MFINNEYMDDNKDYDERQYVAMVGKLLKERKHIKTKADEIKTRKGCKECLELKQDLMTEYYWRKCYERSSKELV